MTRHCPSSKSGPVRCATLVLLVSMALAVAACQPRQNLNPAASPQAATSGQQPVDQLIRLSTLPACDSAKPPVSSNAPDPDPQLDCVLKSSDKLKLTFEVLGVPPETIKVFNAQGREQQSFTQKVDHPEYATPLLQDLDDDNRDEILIPTTAGGTGGKDYEIWRARGDSSEFHDTGSLFGSPQFWKTTDGLFANYTHDSATSGKATFYRFSQDKLTTVATLEVGADIDDSSGQVLGVKCKLSDSSGLLAAEIDPTTAEHKLCSESWIQTIYSN